MTDKKQMFNDERMKANYSFAYQKANELLLNCKNVTKFPIMLKSLITDYTDIAIESFSDLSAKGIDAQSIVGSKDGGLLENRGRFILVYNDKMPQERIRFTVGHEIGHYELNHDFALLRKYRLKNDKCFLPLYDKCEKEANLFSAQLLMPSQIIKELDKRGYKITEEFLMQTFLVSRQAAQVRMLNLNKVYNLKGFSSNTFYNDDFILQKFKDFIDSIAQ